MLTVPQTKNGWLQDMQPQATALTQRVYYTHLARSWHKFDGAIIIIKVCYNALSILGETCMTIEVIAFDADDTLWQNETLYAQAQEVLKRVLAPYAEADQVMQELYETEMRNLPAYGYGIKSFALSMIETAVFLSNGQLPANDINHILKETKEMTAAAVALLPHVADTVAALAADYTLLIITKGDLLDQERKVTRSGLGDYFDHVEIVSQKTPDVYAKLLVRHHISPTQFVMVGNSLRSDILPVVAVGGTAVYIPHDLTWAHENHVDSTQPATYYEVPHMGELPALLRRLQESEMA